MVWGVGPTPDFTGKNMMKICLIRFHRLYSYLIFQLVFLENASVFYERKWEAGVFLFQGENVFFFFEMIAISDVAMTSAIRTVGN